MKPPPVRIDVSRQELESVLVRVRETLGEPDYDKLKAALETLAYLTDLVQDREISLQRLRKILFGASTERTREVAPAPPNTAAEQKESAQPAGEKARPGHGRHAADAFRGARKVEVEHSTLKPGDACPECQKGKVYLQKDPQVLVRVVGQAPLEATVYRASRTGHGWAVPSPAQCQTPGKPVGNGASGRSSRMPDVAGWQAAQVQCPPPDSRRSSGVFNLHLAAATGGQPEGGSRR